VFPARVRAGRVEVFLAAPPRVAEPPRDLELVVASRRLVATDIVALELKHPEGAVLPPFTAGAHVDLRLPSGKLRSYSLCNDPAERGVYRIGVQLGRPSGGGSLEVHELLRDGARIAMGAPVNDFELDEAAAESVLVAGGIGITPLMAMAYRLQALGRRFALHYTCRSADRVAFREELARRLGGGLKLYLDDDAQQRFDARQLLAATPADAMVYVCGPEGFVAHVEAAARALGMDPARVRKESFGKPASSA
jgi:vanillate O-demethylase ferredoxin subunit